MGVIMQANVTVVIITTAALSLLLWTYATMLRQASTRFTWGLLAFAGVLWMQNVIQLYFFATMMRFYVEGVQPLVLVQNVLAALATLVLLAVTWRPVGSKAAPA